MTAIKDYDVYTSRMEKSMYDKLFFIDKIFDDKIDTFLDFGCADGKLITYVHQYMPDWKYIGYDINEKMCAAARLNVPYGKFFSAWEQVLAHINPTTTIINLSSVIHEVYTYSENSAVIKEFWDLVFTSKFAYVIIRDMTRLDEQKLNWFNIQYLIQSRNTKLNQNKQFQDFADYWNIDRPAQIIHFLLKYKYVENWEREVAENYIPLTDTNIETVADKYSNNSYEQIYKNIYTLPYIANQVKQDWDIDLNYFPTHMQFIYKLKEV